METWKIVGHEVAPGQKKQVFLEPDVPGYEMPATLVCGVKSGKTLLITAGIHSGEYPGVAAAVRLAAEIDPASFSGRLLLIHCVNTSGFWAKSPSLIPEDGFNLNGDYPGKPNGSTGERIADYFVTEIFPKIDFIVDLHSGSPMEPLTDCLFFPVGAGQKVKTEALAAAKATDIPYLIASTATTGQYSYAATKMGIPGLLLERGHSGHCRQDWVDANYRDLDLLLNHFGMRNTQDTRPVCAKTVCTKSVYLTSEHKGLWYPAIEEGQYIKKGDLLGHVEDFFGRRIGEHLAEADALVLYYTSGLAVNIGDPLVAYTLTDNMEY